MATSHSISGEAVDADALLLMGRVLRAHGVRGEVKVLPETDDPSRFEAVETLYLGPSVEKANPFTVATVRTQPTKRGPIIVLGLGEVQDRDQAEALRGLSVYALEAELPSLDEDEVYLHDLIGLHVVTEEGEEVGVLRDVMELPAHDVYVVAREARPEVLIPAVPAFIAGIDLEAGQVTVRLIEGLAE